MKKIKYVNKDKRMVVWDCWKNTTHISYDGPKVFATILTW